MNARLGLVARRARLDAGLTMLDIAQTAHVSEKTVSRFERGEGWRRDTDHVVATYARLLGLEPLDLWRAALDSEE